jgi:tellurite resistance protein
MIKSILDLLGLGSSSGEPAPIPPNESTAVREIITRLEGLDVERARYIVIFAMVLARAARADLEVNEDERWVMIQILREHAGLAEDQAELAVELVAHRNQLFGVTEDYAATKQFNEIATDEHRECMLRCLFAVCAADDSISLVEEEEVRQIASELGLTHEHYVEARQAFREKREVLRGLPRRRRAAEFEE